MGVRQQKMKTILMLIVVTMMFGNAFALADSTLAVRRNEKDGTCNLVVAQTNPSLIIIFEILRLLQYEPNSSEWVDRIGEIPAGMKASKIKPGTLDVLSPITHRVGLFWLEWKEDGQTRSAFVHSGPVLCNDVKLGPPPKPDLIAQCVPGTNSAKAVFVPDPRKLKKKDKK